MNINSVIIGGNLTKDVELKYLPSGTACANFSIANNQTYLSNGEKKQDVSFINVTAFGKTAENISKYFSKGKPIVIEGKLKTDQWEKDGQKQSRTKVVANSFHFVGYKSDDNKQEDRSDINQQEDGGWE